MDQYIHWDSITNKYSIYNTLSHRAQIYSVITVIRLKMT